MKRNLIFTILTAILFISVVTYNAFAVNTFPTTENVWEAGDIIEESWGNSLENRIGANATTSRTTLTYQVNTLMATTSLPQLSILSSQISDIANYWDGRLAATTSVASITTLPGLMNIGTTTGVAYLNSGFLTATSSLGAGYFNITGNWSGTFDNQEGSYYLNFNNLINTGTSTLPTLSSVGTITTGAWNATAIANTKGGTGQDSSGWTGFAGIAGGTWSASTTLSGNYFEKTSDWTGTLDSIEGASFLRSDAADSATGLLTFTGGFTVPNASTTQGLDIAGYLNANTASSTFAGTLNIGIASSTNYYGGLLTSCTGASNALQWTAGSFSCGSITAGATASSTLLGDNNIFTGLNVFNSASTSISNLKTLTLSATSTNFYSNIGSYFVINNASSTIANLKTNTLAIASDGTLTAPAGFGGRSLTVNGTALDADAELYTKPITFKLVSTSTSAMSTSTQYAAHKIPLAFTITNAYGFCDGAATTSVKMQERTNPEIAGTEVFDDFFKIGDNSATTTFANAGIASGAWIVVSLEGYHIGTPTRCFLNIAGTYDD